MATCLSGMKDIQSNKVSTLWLNGKIRNIDHVCLASMIANNLDVTLYHYGALSNVPSGVKLADASEILDLSLLDRLQCIKKKEHNPQIPIAQFSDFFRIILQKKSKGLWLDTDVFIFRPFTYNLDKVYFCHEGKGRIGYPVIYLPPNHPIIEEYENLLLQDTLMPNWLGFIRGKLRPFIWTLLRQKFSPSDLGITIYGNDGFSRLTKRHNCFKEALNKELFFHWTGKETERLFQKVDFENLINNPKHLGIHIHRKQWENLPINSGSFWEWALSKYGKEIN